MKSIVIALALTLAATACFAKDGILISYADVVKPDAEFLRFMDGFGRLITGSEGHDRTSINAMFSPTVKTFLKRETPFEAFLPAADINADPLLKSADILANRQTFSAHTTDENRQDAVIEDVLTYIGRDDPFGRMTEAPGLICSSAALEFDRRAAAKFARMHKVRLDDLIFFENDIVLYHQKNMKGEVVGIVPPRTIMVGQGGYMPYDDWHPLISSTGVKGYAYNHTWAQSIARQHVCFGKVNGQYKITTIMGYKR